MFFWILDRVEDDSGSELGALSSGLTATGSTFPLARGLARLMPRCEAVVYQTNPEGFFYATGGLDGQPSLLFRSAPNVG